MAEMKIDIDRLKYFHEIGGLTAGLFGDAQETACLMSALTGGTSFKECGAAGWPKWLAELGAWFFDTASDGARYEESLQFAVAVRNARDAGVSFDAMFCDIRLDSILPIAMASVGEGGEPWRVKCREAIQWSIDLGGTANPHAARAAGAAAWASAWAAEATDAAGAIDAADAAWAAAWAAEATDAAGAIDAAAAAWAADNWLEARQKIFASTIKTLNAHGAKPAESAQPEKENQCLT